MIKYKIYKFDEVVSTNTLLREGDYPIGSVALARTQTGGKGRNGKSFCSPPFGLYMSMVVGYQSIFDKLFIPIKAAVCAYLVLSQYVKCQIKWPNDIITEDKKLCGILSESYNDKVIVGFGMNLNASDEYFIRNNLPHATSLHAQTGKRYNTDTAAREVLKAYSRLCDKTAVMQIYKENCLTLGKRITVFQGETKYDAEAVDLTKNGELVVLAGGRRLTVNSGEVSIRG